MIAPVADVLPRCECHYCRENLLVDYGSFGGLQGKGLGFRPLLNLRVVRGLRGLTQIELSRLAEVGQETISYVESGSPARADTARKLAEALGVSVADLEGDA